MCPSGHADPHRAKIPQKLRVHVTKTHQVNSCWSRAMVGGWMLARRLTTRPYSFFSWGKLNEASAAMAEFVALALWRTNRASNFRELKTFRSCGTFGSLSTRRRLSSNSLAACFYGGKMLGWPVWQLHFPVRFCWSSRPLFIPGTLGGHVLLCQLTDSDIIQLCLLFAAMDTPHSCVRNRHAPPPYLLQKRKKLSFLKKSLRKEIFFKKTYDILQSRIASMNMNIHTSYLHTWTLTPYTLTVNE